MRSSIMNTPRSLEAILEPPARTELREIHPNMTERQLESMVLARTIMESRGLEKSVRAYQAQAAIKITREALYREYPYESLRSTREFLQYVCGIDGSKLSDLDGISQVATWCDARDLPIDDYITPEHYPPLVEAMSHMRTCMDSDDTVGMYELFNDVDKVVESDGSYRAIRDKYRTSRSKTDTAHAMYEEGDGVYVIVIVGKKDGGEEELRMSIARRVEFDLVGGIMRTRPNSLDISVSRP